MDYDRLGNLAAMFFTQAERLADRPFLWSKTDGAFRPLTWRQTATAVTRLAKGLKALGVERGDRVALISENRPEWLIADLAIMAAGAITVPGYTTGTPGDYVHLFNDSRARLVVVSTKALTEKVLRACLDTAILPGIVTIETQSVRQSSGPEIRPWDQVLELGDGQDFDVAEEIAATRRTDTACVIYTSGTGGAPKGVMTSHGAIISNCMGAFHLLEEISLGDEVFLSFLPLSHSYEHTAGQFFPISIGAQIYYAESIEHLASNMAEVRPTIMTAVPRLYETMRGRIVRAVERQGGLPARLFQAALKLGAKRIEDPGALTLLERMADKGLDFLVRRKVAKRFGGRLKAFVSGGAPLNYEVGLFFSALGVPLLQGYGQTESAPVVSCNRPFHARLRTVGPPMRGVEVKIAEDGEILVRGELVMQGYWGDPAATALAIQDGWLHTGDIGVIHADGAIEITDRKRDIIVNSGGDNIAPQRIEGMLALQPEIAQAMVHGNRRPHLVALLVPDAEDAARWAEVNGKPADLGQLAADPAFRRHVGQAVDRVNATLSGIEKVRRYILSPEPFTIDNEMLTPTLKIRRHVIHARHGEALEALYEDRRA